MTPAPTTAPPPPPDNGGIPGLPGQIGCVALANPLPDVDPCRLADRSQIEVSGYYPTRGASDDYVRPCSIADIGAAGVVRQIASGNTVPSTDGRAVKIALGRLDACGLLDRSLVPEITSVPATGYNGWKCELGSSSDGAERIEVNLQFRSQLEPTGTIGAFRIRQTSGSSEYGVSGCAVYLEVVRRATVAPDRSEIVRFGSFGKAGFDDQCARAQKIATAAVGRLPTPT